MRTGVAVFSLGKIDQDQLAGYAERKGSERGGGGGGALVLKITDRLKDLIKSGGEWISSVDLENALVAHEAVREAAVIAVAHHKWQERPLALVLLKDGCVVDAYELRTFLERRFPRWHVPDGFVFVNELARLSQLAANSSDFWVELGDNSFR